MCVLPATGLCHVLDPHATCPFLSLSITIILTADWIALCKGWRGDLLCNFVYAHIHKETHTHTHTKTHTHAHAHKETHTQPHKDTHTCTNIYFFILKHQNTLLDISQYRGLFLNFIGQQMGHFLYSTAWAPPGVL